MNRLIIGLTGRAGCGKDTVAKILADVGAFQRLAFADPLKDAAAAMFGVPRAYFDEPIVKESRLDYWGMSPREMAQRLGTEAGRNVFGADLWLKRAGLALMTAGPRVVVTDVRFDNEAGWLRERGGIVVRIVRPGAAEVAAHVSEAGVSDALVSIEMRNDESVSVLAMRVRALYVDLLRERNIVPDPPKPQENRNHRGIRPIAGYMTIDESKVYVQRPTNELIQIGPLDVA